MMAEATGKLTGRPGICFVTRGPGATNASAGVHIAFQDSTPLILFIGQVARDQRDREAFQEIDYRRMFGQMSKWVAEVDDAARLPEYVSRAFHVATAGRPGPVVLALPEDMLGDVFEVVDPAPYQPITVRPATADVDAIAARLARASRPLAIIGGGGWTAQAAADIARFADAWDLPVATSFRCQDYLDNTHRCYAGHVGIGIDAQLAERVRSADVLLVIGARLGEMTTSGYKLLDIPKPRQALIHVFADASELGRVYQPEIGLVASLPAIAAVLAETPAPFSMAPWAGAADAAHAGWREFNRPRPCAGDLQMAEIVAALRELTPPETVVANGAGNYAIWVHRFHRWQHYRSQLAPTSGSMGYGVPAAIAAALADRQRPVICFAGDGCFMMSAAELATAVQLKAPVVFIVVNNGMYGTIRMHQERRYPGRVSGTALHNPDFAALARAFGMPGQRIDRTAAFAPAFAAALAADGPTLLELAIDPEALTPVETLSEIRAAAQANAP